MIEYGFTVERKEATPALIRQVHGRKIVAVDETSSSVEEADGVYTYDREREIYVFTADCLPVLAYTKDTQGPVAAIHAGWRGAKQGIVRALESAVGDDFARMYFALGPSIAKCCFEVKEDFLAVFHEAARPTAPYLDHRAGKMFFDLPRFVVEQELAGVDGKRISMGDHRCTVCSTPPLPSYRRNGGTDPRIRAWIVRK